jgi:hypothetical protein
MTASPAAVTHKTALRVEQREHDLLAGIGADVDLEPLGETVEPPT